MTISPCGAVLGTSPASAATYAATPNVSDTFSRSVTNGWGTADLGGPYTVAPSTQFSVAPGRGRIGPVPAGTSARTALANVAELDQRLQVTVRLPALPTTGGGGHLALEFRRQANGDAYRAKLNVRPGGTLMLGFSRVRSGAETTLGATFTVPTEPVA